MIGNVFYGLVLFYNLKKRRRYRVSNTSSRTFPIVISTLRLNKGLLIILPSCNGVTVCNTVIKSTVCLVYSIFTIQNPKPHVGSFATVVRLYTNATVLSMATEQNYIIKLPLGTTFLESEKLFNSVSSKKWGHTFQHEKMEHSSTTIIVLHGTVL